MDCAAACSQHPVTAHAVGEVVGQVLETLGDRPPAALVVVTPGHAGALEDAVAAVRSLLHPGTVIGWAARQVATSFPRSHPVAARPRATVGLWAGGPPSARSVDGRSAMLSAALPGPALVVGTAGARLPAAGALDGAGALARSDVGGAPVVLDGAMLAEGWVGVSWPAGSGMRHLAFEGRRPVGPAVRATAVEGVLLAELDGRPSMEVLTGIARDQVPARDIELINRTVHLEVPGTGAVVALRGRDRATGALVLGTPVAAGDIVRFCVLDPDEAVDTAAATLASAPGLVWDAGAGATTRPGEPAAGSVVLSWSAGPEPAVGAAVHALVPG